MKKCILVLAALAPLSLCMAEARADANKPVQYSGPPVQTAPPAPRPYGRPAPPPLPPPPPGRYAEPPTPGARRLTRIAITPAYGGTAWIYDDDLLVGTLDRPGWVFLPEGRAYRVVITRGDSTVWQGHVLATPGTVDLSWDRWGNPVVERTPPPPPSGGPVGLNQLMPPPMFRDALRDLDNLPDEQSRMDWIQRTFAYRPLTVNQANQLLGRLAFEDSRVRALYTLGPNLVQGSDPGRLLDSFFTPSARSQAARILGIQ
jgi:hypothetical protein